MSHDELINFCYSFIIDGGTERVPMAIADAEYTLKCWKEEKNELAEDTANLTAGELMTAWNNVLAYFSD